ENSGKLVFHSVGDTGGANTPTYIEGVSRFMELDMAFAKRAQSATISPDNLDAPRRTMTQPNVFWTMNTPLATIIGMYSNCPEGGQISDTQRSWFISELKAADPSLPIILDI